MQFEECKKQLNVGDVMMIMVFAQNWTHHSKMKFKGDIGPENKAHCIQLLCTIHVKKIIIILFVKS